MSDISGSPRPANTVNRRRLLIYGAGGVAVIGLYWWWTRQKASTAADTTGTLDSTGLDQYGNPIGYGPVGAVPGGTVTVPSGGIVLPTSNQEWFQMSVTYLTGLGYNSAAVGVALGKYLSKQALTSQQAHFVEMAMGAYGPPPTSPGPPIITPPSGWAGTRFTPRITWAPLGPKYAQLIWSPIPGATSYHLLHNANLLHTSTGVTFRVPRKSGRYHVLAYHDGSHSHPSNVVTVK